MAFRVQAEKDYAFVLKSLLAGGVAGMCSKTTVAPLDRVKILLQAHNRHYKHLGVLSGLREVIQRETFAALYKGNCAQMIRIFPYAATQFTTFELYKKVTTPPGLYLQRSTLCSSVLKYLGGLLGKRHTHIDKFLAGSAAGVTAVTLTYPLDIIRARLAFQVTGEHVYVGIAHAAVSIFKSEGGVRALYRGFWPTIIGMIPYAGFSFYSFEKLKYLCMKYAPDHLCQKCDRNTGGLVLTIPARLLCGGIAGAVAQSFSYPLDVTRRRMQLGRMNHAKHRRSFGMWKTVRMIYHENGVVRGLYRGMSINYLRAIPMVSVSFTTYEAMKQILRLDTGMKL